MKTQNCGGSGRVTSPNHLTRAQWQSVRVRSLIPSDVFQPITPNRKYR